MIGMKRILRFPALSLALALLLASLLVINAWADIPSPNRYFYVYDEPSVLSLTTEDHIVTENERLYTACGAQIVIACVNTTGDMDIADFADRMFNQWKIGSSAENNGVLVLMSIDEDDYYAVQGRGLENLLSSGTLKLMLDRYLEPHFARKDYDAGALAIFDALRDFVAQIYPAAASLTGGTESSTALADDGNSDAGFDFDFDLDQLFEEQIPAFLGDFSLTGLIGKAIRAVVGFISGVTAMSFVVMLILLVLVLRILFGRRGGRGPRFRGLFLIPFIGALRPRGGSPFRGGPRPGSFGGGHGGFRGGGSHGGGGFTRGGGAGRR